MQVYGLVGNPVGHSLSPPMHEAAYDAAGIDARYVTFEPSPDRLAAAVEGADALGVAGLNVTIPFKERVLDLVAPDDLARRIGAVNTVDFRGERPDGGGPGDEDDGDPPDGSDANATGEASADPDGVADGRGPPTGHNTDAAGALRALREAGADPDGATAVVVGAGGAGRAVAFGLADASADVRIANRTVERAEALAADLGSDATAGGATAHGLDALRSVLGGADLLVNATSVGMGENASPVPAGALHGDLVVLDAVYRPLETRLLRDARERGATTVDGGRMLLYQGAEAFETWTGREAPVEAMERALYDRL